MNYDIVVAGGGLTGLYYANKMAELGYKTAILEEHNQIGEPSHCAGIISEAYLQVEPKLSQFIVNKAEELRVISPSGKEAIIEGTAYIIDRVSYDKHLGELCESAGAKIFLGKKFDGINSKGIKAGKLFIGYKIAAIADGAKSWLGRKINPRKLLPGVQVRARLRVNSSQVTVMLGSKIAPEFFAWIVPEDERTARIGLAGLRPGGHLKMLLKRLDVSRVLTRHAGLIPITFPRKICLDRLIFLGDAAGFVKATTGGGIVPGLKSTQIAIEASIMALEAECFNRNFLEEVYTKRWRKDVGGSLKRHFQARKIFEKLNDDALDIIVEYLHEKSKVLSRLEEWDTLRRLSRIAPKLFSLKLIWILLNLIR